jgi:succinyl-CoA synthetase alpha subunit
MVLMYLSAQLSQLPGVERAMAVMGTDANKELLATVALLAPEVDRAGPSDLVIALRAVDDETATRAEGAADAVLAQTLPGEGDNAEVTFRSLEGAARGLPGANLALISVPGRYAAREARRAIDLGLHVFLFSDNVPLADEVELKRLGRERGLLVMGPDCGTAIVNGAALGFANVVERGPVGIVGASGTGTQELCALLDRAGVGVSHALGTGGRDLAAAVGASTTLQALAMLEADPRTEVIIVVSKIPAPEVAAQVLERARACRKPVVACLLGVEAGEQANEVRLVGTLADAAEAAVALAGAAPVNFSALEPKLWAQGLVTRNTLTPDQRYVRGLFSGGSLCEEAMVVWRRSLGGVWSNAPLAPERRLPDPRRSLAHTAVDLGDDLFTVGRPHPMIDPSARCERILAEAADPAVAVLVLDVVLGYGSHPDMAGALAPTLADAKARARADGRNLEVVAHVCGTAGDPQGLAAQEAKLQAVGVLTAPSNAAAAKLAAVIATGDGPGS